MVNDNTNQTDNSHTDTNQGGQSAPTPGSTVSTPADSGTSKHGRGWIIPAVTVGLITLLLGFGGGWVSSEMTSFTVVSERPQNQQTDESSTSETPQLEVPEQAEVIIECSEGRGKQYVLPENIPFGPVYNVWEGEITSVEYMLGKEEFLGNKDYINVDLMNANYDHMNIGLLSQGHAGYPEPHYHIDLFTISHEESQQITCE